MCIFSRLLLATFIIMGLSAPVVSLAALGVPFGGRVVSWIPCIGGAQITVAGPRPGIFIWYYTTPTFLNGPPRPGVSVLGTIIPAPGICMAGKIPLFGAPITVTGTSLAI